MSACARWSVVIPVFNEEKGIAQALEALRKTPGGAGAEIIVVDGGSKDRTVQEAQEKADRVLRVDRPGRGNQFRKGVEASSGSMILFLHADCRLPEFWDRAIERAFDEDGVAGTAFSIDYGRPEWNYRLLERLVHWRARRYGVVYGDHAVATSRQVYDRIGGIPDVPIMEDLELASRIRRVGRLRLLPETVRASNRRQRRKGVLINSIRNGTLIALYKLGVSPARIWKWYYNRRVDH